MLAKVKFLQYIIPIPVLLIISSCAVLPVPIPHVDTVVPSVEGHLANGGTPVADRTVIYNWGWDGAEWRYTAETTTSANGDFFFPKKSKLHLIEFLVVVADCGYEYRLAVKEQDAERPLAVGLFFGPCYGMPKQLTVNCELTEWEEDCCEFSETPVWNNYVGYRIPWE